jgi:nucleoside-diphosphate-sugar epimerase
VFETAVRLVTVTGAAGFIALHCIERLLGSGYRVRGTLRRLADQEEVRRALAHVPGASDRLEFCVADLTADAGWSEAMSGSTFVLHTASPVPARQPADEDEVIVPARDGTVRVLRAASTAGVARVVLTSSMAAVASGVPRGPDRVLTEEDWSDLQAQMSPYSRSKTLAERVAWEFVQGLPADRRLELTTINPSYVLGPSLRGVGNASNELVRKVLDREVPGLPRLMLPIVDVRDVADAHLLAMMHPAASGERFIVSEGDYWYAQLVAILAAEGYDVPMRVVPNWVVRVIGWFDPTVRSISGVLGLERHVSADKARRVLGWTTRGVRETLLDTARDIVSRRARG